MSYFACTSYSVPPAVWIALRISRVLALRASPKCTATRNATCAHGPTRVASLTKRRPKPQSINSVLCNGFPSLRRRTLNSVGRYCASAQCARASTSSDLRTTFWHASYQGEASSTWTSLAEQASSRKRALAGRSQLGGLPDEHASTQTRARHISALHSLGVHSISRNAPTDTCPNRIGIRRCDHGFASPSGMKGFAATEQGASYAWRVQMLERSRRQRQVFWKNRS